MSFLPGTNIIDHEKKSPQPINKGEVDDFWKIWNNHKNYLYCYCFKKMNNNAVDAQEVLSISMLKAWEKFPKYSAKITNTRGWLIRLTQNVCFDFYRQKNRGFIPSNKIDDFNQLEANNGMQFIKLPDDFIMSNELKIVISQEINSLKQSFKVPLVMRFVFEKSYEEIAKELNISEVNVRKRIQKGRAILKKEIKSYFRGKNHLESLVSIEEKFDIFSEFQLDDFLELNHQVLPMIDSHLEEGFYQLYTTHLETLPSPLLMEEIAYV